MKLLGVFNTPQHPPSLRLWFRLTGVAEITLLIYSYCIVLWYNQYQSGHSVCSFQSVFKTVYKLLSQSVP